MDAIDDRLAVAQRAMDLPEVQEMLRRLAVHNLGIFMPHMHDEAGSMLPMPAGMVQVEDDLAVSFKPASQIEDASEASYVTVGWSWSAEMNMASPQVVCRVEKQSDGNYKHVKSSYGH